MRLPHRYNFMHVIFPLHDVAWKMWQVPAEENTGQVNIRTGPSDSILSPPPLSPTKPVEEPIEEEGEGENEGEEQVGTPTVVSLPPAATAPPKDEGEPKQKGGISSRPRSHSWDPELRRETYLDLGAYGRKKGFGRHASLFKKRVVRTAMKATLPQCTDGPRVLV